MARKLPWAADASTADIKPSSKHTASLASEKEKKKEIARPVTPEPTPQISRNRATARSPSTSPIRPADPAPQIEPMCAGLHADDRYMMVEDEFEAVAKQYTAHLHAAEYSRLKRKAKETPPKPLPNFSPSMSRTSTMNLERKSLLSRQNTMLSDFGKRGAHHDTLSDNDGQDVEEEAEHKMNDLWSGTSLAGLMGDNSQTKTSLIGLHRMNSSTRAANGFSRGNTESSPKKKRKTIADIFTDDGHGTRDKEVELPVQDRSARIGKHRHVDGDRNARPVKKEVSSPGVRRSRIDDIDDFDQTSITKDNSNAAARRKSGTARYPSKPASTWTKRLDPRKGKEKDRKARLDEVPVFLV